MKYFLDCDTNVLYSVPKQYQFLIEIITSKASTAYEINNAKHRIVSSCKPKLTVSALTQTL